MMETKDIQELVKVFDQSSIDELAYKTDNTSITLKKIKQEVQPSGTEATNNILPQPVLETKDSPKELSLESKTVSPTNRENYHEILSPMVGTVYISASPEADPYVKVGTKVSEKTIVCIVEAMKLFNEIEAEVAGEIIEILVEDGQLVEYGQPLFLVNIK
ncbi:acetyl-CoA carboxylase biotin carboxyl carrier protein [Priestia aryabhattai]|uniref:acetyl-CoA carboxylase biotin carboxyl carrier protein n=1 Tax=Priestia megaterium TaxID=1404 RepID=UPI0039B8291A